MVRTLPGRGRGWPGRSLLAAHRLRQPTPDATLEQIATLRRQRWPGDQIAQQVGVSPATVSRVLQRLGLSKLRALAPAEPIRRYERATPGELIHLDIKKLGRFDQVGHRITGERAGQSRGAGWEFAHVGLDVASRIAFAQILPDERKESAVAFLQAALAYYASLGLREPRRQRPARQDRQRLLLPLRGFCQDLPTARAQAPQDPTLYAQDQRQGRALHPVRPQGMGLRPSLSNLGPARSGAAGLAPPLQLASPARWYKIADAHQPTRPRRGQPVEAPHLRYRRLSKRSMPCKRPAAPGTALSR